MTGIQDSGHDSDYEIKLKPPQPLDNKSYPSASRIATQRVIKTNRARKQTSTPNAGSLPAAAEPAQKSYQTNDQASNSKVLSEATIELDSITIPDKTTGKTLDGLDEMPTQSKIVLPDATNTVSQDATKNNTEKTKSSADKPESCDSTDEKPSKGVFKMKTITIRRSKDPHTFKCSLCSTRASTLRELNAHFIQNHRNVDCDMCGKSFLTPASLSKHRYSHIEESEQFQCHICNKRFPFESQLKLHRYMYRGIRYYRCASANCGKFKTSWWPSSPCKVTWKTI